MDELKQNFKINIKDFDIKVNIGGRFNSRYMKPKYSPEIPEHKLKYKNAEDLAKDIKMEPDMRYYIVVDGTFIFGDFLEAVLVLNNIRVKSMTIATLSLSQNNIDSLANLIEGGFIEKLNIIISDFYYSHERNGLIPYIYDKLDKDDKFQMAVCSSHMKVNIFETASGNKVVMHGSANMRSSSNLEQLIIEENKSLYDFNNDLFSKIINKYHTINKSLRSKNLRETIK